MIIIGYPGVGKTTASKMYREIVDLPSYLFDDKNTYCDVAINLSKQNLIVCVSSHKEVVEKLLASDEPICVVYPNENLKLIWVNIVRRRYLEDKTDRNYRALMRVWGHFDEDIEYLMSTPFEKVELSDGEFLAHKLVVNELKEEDKTVIHEEASEEEAPENEIEDSE